MKVLIVTFYYPPDLSAGSFRAKSLVEALQAEGMTSLHIDVITTLPNRYRSHMAAAPELEEYGQLCIRRIVLPSHRSGMADQAYAFSAFARRVWSETRGKRWDVVVATSSRLMTAVLGACLAKRASAPLYLDIRDLFTDTMSDLLSGSALRNLLPLFHYLERRTLNAAKRVNVVSEGFLPYIKEVAPEQSFRVFTNGIDDEFLTINFAKAEGKKQDLPLIVYAGNMGEGQGLHKIVPEAARLLKGRARFRLIGDGGRREQLENALADTNSSNVEVINAVPRSELFEHYRKADVLFVHLNDQAAFHKVLPSKIFEYAATGRPILAGVAGYPAEFFRTQVPGVEVFKPCDAGGMAVALERLLAGSMLYDRGAFFERYARTSIMREMARDVLFLGGGHE